MALVNQSSFIESELHWSLASFMCLQIRSCWSSCHWLSTVFVPQTLSLRVPFCSVLQSKRISKQSFPVKYCLLNPRLISCSPLPPSTLICLYKGVFNKKQQMICFSHQCPPFSITFFRTALIHTASQRKNLTKQGSSFSLSFFS